MINVLLVDDHELVRTGIEAILNAAKQIKVVSVASSGEEAITVLAENPVDVVLMDINMPGIGGVEACRRILQQNGDVKIVALSVQNNGPVPNQLLKLGVLGFISKNSSAEEMVKAIKTVMLGKIYICVDVANNLALQGLLGTDQSPFSKLSQREAEIVTLILQGKTIKEMAEMLVLSDKTINTYRYRLYEKLKIKNDVELTCLAVKFDHIDMWIV